jgi:hypothetical protein
LRNTFRDEFLLSLTRPRFTRHFQYELSGHRLDSVDFICNLGVFLDSQPNFTSHIDSLVVKASMMLGYIRRIGTEFRDPYTLKTLYNSFVRSHLDYAIVVWNPYYAVHLKRIEAILKKFLRSVFFIFYFCTLGWSRDIELPPYCQRCRLTYLSIMSSRRRVSYALFASDVLSCKLDCPIIAFHILYLHEYYI